MENTTVQDEGEERPGVLFAANDPQRASPHAAGIATLAARLCHTGYASVVLFHKDGCQLLSAFGFPAAAFVSPVQAVVSLYLDVGFHIPDVAGSALFSAHPFLPVAAGSYAGAFFKHAGGTACIIVADENARTLTDTEADSLQLLAQQAEAALAGPAHPVHNNDIEIAQIGSIFRNATDAVIITDDNGIITEWNGKAEAIFGWKAQEMKGAVFAAAIVAPPSLAAYRALFGRRYIAPGADSQVESAARRKDGQVIEVAIAISPATLAGRHYKVHFVADITTRLETTEQLNRQREFYENILNQLPSDIAVFDANHKYLFVNPGAISDPELRKYIVGKDDYQYAAYRNRDKSVADRRRSQFMEVKESGREIRWEDTVLDPYGRPITHLRRLFPVKDENGELSMVIGFGLDITDRKIMEVKQSALVKQLSGQNTQLIDFCNIVSHNLRAPLVNMSMLVEFIQETNDTAEQKMLVNKLKPVLDNLHVTFNELVESIQIKQDLEIKSEKIDLQQCLLRTIEGLDTEINKSCAKIEANFADAPEIYCPSKYLFSIFHNLVSNSLKYQSPERPPIVRISTQKEGDKVILSVSDNGLGIDMVKHKDNIFKIGKVFHKHPNAKGFGLFMTRTQVEAMDGKIWAESEPGKGTTFFIEFKNQK